MLGFAPLKRTGWAFVTTGLALVGVALAIGAPVAHKGWLEFGIAAAALFIVLLGITSFRRRDPSKLVELVAEGAQVLNLDPMELIPPGEPKVLDMAVSALEMRAHLWGEDVMEALKAAHATPGEVQSFDLLGTYAPVGPSLSAAHERIKGMLAARMERLRAIIKQMETES